MPADAPLLSPLTRILDVVCASMAIEKSVLLYALDYFCKRAYAKYLIRLYFLFSKTARSESLFVC